MTSVNKTDASQCLPAEGDDEEMAEAEDDEEDEEEADAKKKKKAAAKPRGRPAKAKEPKEKAPAKGTHLPFKNGRLLTSGDSLARSLLHLLSNSCMLITNQAL